MLERSVVSSHVPKYRVAAGASTDGGVAALPRRQPPPPAPAPAPPPPRPEYSTMRKYGCAALVMWCMGRMSGWSMPSPMKGASSRVSGAGRARAIGHRVQPVGVEPQSGWPYFRFTLQHVWPSTIPYDTFWISGSTVQVALNQVDPLLPWDDARPMPPVGHRDVQTGQGTFRTAVPPWSCTQTGTGAPRYRQRVPCSPSPRAQAACSGRSCSRSCSGLGSGGSYVYASQPFLSYGCIHTP